MPTLLADRRLAARIERSAVKDLLAFTETCAQLDPSLRPAHVEFAGGAALYLAPGSPINSIFGAGIGSAVTGGEVDAVQEFYRARCAPAAISLCPLADASLVANLAVRGWLLADFESVLVLPLGGNADRTDVADDVGIRVACSLEDRSIWSSISSRAFAGCDEPTLETTRLGQAMAARADLVLLIGAVDGADAGAGALWIDDGIGWLLGDATLPEWRRKGVQSALQAKRVRLAAEAGCELAVTEAHPGSTSQRNMERRGFRVVYTRVELLAPPR